MNYRLCLGALYPVSVNMAHNIVPNLFFALLGNIVIYIVTVRFKFGNLLIRYRQAELLFRARKRNPKSAPGAEFKILRKNKLHFIACIPC